MFQLVSNRSRQLMGAIATLLIGHAVATSATAQQSSPNAQLTKFPPTVKELSARIAEPSDHFDFGENQYLHLGKKIQPSNPIAIPGLH